MDKRTSTIVRHAEESEKSLEKYLVKRSAEQGGICLKYHSAIHTGYPDRICLLPGHVMIWVELKSKGCRPTRIQEHRHEQLRQLGHTVYVCDSKAQIDEMLRHHTHQDR